MTKFLLKLYEGVNIIIIIICLLYWVCTRWQYSYPSTDKHDKSLCWRGPVKISNQSVTVWYTQSIVKCLPYQ
jgi:hypothetical protein